MTQLIDIQASFVPLTAICVGQPGQSPTPVDPVNPLPVAVRGTGVTYADRSGTVAVGGTAQQIAAANPTRRGLFIMNLSSADLWFDSMGAAQAGIPSIRIGAGILYESPAHGVPVTAISVLGATSGQAFSAREW